MPIDWLEKPSISFWGKILLKQLFILAICIYLLIDVRFIAGRNNIIAVMAICVAIGTTLNNIFETIKGGE